MRKLNMLRYSSRPVLFNEALKQEVKGEELGIRRGEGFSCTEAPGGPTGALPRQLDNVAHAHLKTTAPWVM
ncbi:hypothetical protein DPMN_002068 [Dreissena polymorpha]|uniref:Uncharacterized protein n=1 Tax=Dreissena polymorpha TaxID=45954 RepID=A0A9D4MIF2_DREPO|nr:hypothetical protein DPMN_002068 [Dreissena polymorpha]